LVGADVATGSFDDTDKALLNINKTRQGKKDDAESGNRGDREVKLLISHLANSLS